MKLLISSIVFIFFGCTIFCSCTDSRKDMVNMQNAPIPINVYTARTEKIEYFDKYPGNVVAMMQVDIRPEAEGYVTGIFFKEGDHVRKGQKLYEIDNRIYKATKNQADANLKVAKANLDQAKKDADRYTYLNEHDAIAKQTLDHALTTLKNAKNQVAAAKQDVLKTETDLNYAYVKAPFDGIIGISQVKTGNAVAKGQTILNTISTDNPMAVDFVINEKQIQRFLLLQKHKNNDSVFSIILPDNTLYNKTGKILLMDRGVNPQTGTITIRLIFPNKDAMLRTGMSCLVRVRNTDTMQQILIPNKAIVEQMGEYFVFVAKDTLIAKDNNTNDQKNKEKPITSLHAIQRKVTLGQAINDRIIVKNGLQPDENIIVDGVQRLRDGNDVTLGKPEIKK